MRVRKESLNMGPKAMAVFMLIAGLILGFVFTFGMNYWHAEIAESDALHVEATYDSYEKDYRKSRIQQIFVNFSDYDRLTIDSILVSDDLIETLDALPKKTKLYLTAHPNSDTIMAMQTESTNILNFDDVQQKLQNENKVFFVLGIFAYLCAIIGGVHLIRDHLRKSKRKKA